MLACAWLSSANVFAADFIEQFGRYLCVLMFNKSSTNKSQPLLEADKKGSNLRVFFFRTVKK